TWLVRDDLKAGRLVAILDEAATDGLPLSLIWPVARQLTPKIHVLVQKLEAHLHTG
ncbi:LysR family transcriptional regulator, partial [Burkholderia multivorans]